MQNTKIILKKVMDLIYFRGLFGGGSDPHFIKASRWEQFKVGTVYHGGKSNKMGIKYNKINHP